MDVGAAELLLGHRLPEVGDERRPGDEDLGDVAAPSASSGWRRPAPRRARRPSRGPATRRAPWPGWRRPTPSPGWPGCTCSPTSSSDLIEPPPPVPSTRRTIGTRYSLASCSAITCLAAIDASDAPPRTVKSSPPTTIGRPSSWARPITKLAGWKRREPSACSTCLPAMAPISWNVPGVDELVDALAHRQLAEAGAGARPCRRRPSPWRRPRGGAARRSPAARRPVASRIRAWHSDPLGTVSAVTASAAARLVAALVVAAVGLAFADASVVALALPDLYAEFDTSIVGVSWVLTTYALVVAVTCDPGRAAAPPRASAVAASSSASPCSPRRRSSPGSPTAWRCCSSPAPRRASARRSCWPARCPCSARSSRSPRRLGRAAWWALAGAVGAAIGPALGGVLTELFDWRAIFFVQAPIVAGALVVAIDPAARSAAPRGPPPRPHRAPGGAT